VTEGRLFQLLKPEVLPSPGSPLTISVARLSKELQLYEEEEDEVKSKDKAKETLNNKDPSKAYL